MRNMISPRSARAARIHRMVQQTDHCPTSAAEQMTWVNSQLRVENDRRMSLLEERIRERYIPTAVGEHAITSSGQERSGNLYYFREFPMYPGEYIPANHNSLASLRDELRMDITAQSLKDAWIRVSEGSVFTSSDQYYASVDGLDEHRLGEIVSAVLPGFHQDAAKDLVSRVLDSISRPTSTPARSLSRTISAEAVGLDNAPGHYSNFLEWMGRITETKAFKTEHALFQFSRRKFNKYDVRVMNENYRLMSKKTLQTESADGYSHFHSVLRDLVVKHAGDDTRHQIGVRIDEAEVDLETGIAVGYGQADFAKITAYLRENRDHNGSATFMGKPVHVMFDNEAWTMEHLLWPFDEAGLDYRDFDVYYVNEGNPTPTYTHDFYAFACRLALAQAISKMIPLTRIALKKSGLLSFDRRHRLGDHPKFIDHKSQGRVFHKR